MKKKASRICALFLSLIMSVSVLSSTVTSASAATASTETQSSEIDNNSIDNTQSVSANSSADNDIVTVGAIEKGTGDIRLSDEEKAKISKIESVSDYYEMVEEESTTGADNKPLLSRSATSDYKSSVDNSTSKYFPPIGDQGSTGSCTCWAQIYYQLSYMENRELDRAATLDNSLSAMWMYPLVNGGNDLGSSAGDVLQTAIELGAPTMKTSPNTDDYKKWNMDREALEEAQNYRVDDYAIFSTGAGNTPITGPDDSDLAAIKAALQNGEILTFSTYISGWNYEQIQENSQVPENSKYEGEYIATYAYGIGGAHRMTLVGYNDNIWVDINHDGKIQTGEKGAFKIANSWGADYEGGNNGFIWMSYDMINTKSSVANSYLNPRRANAGAASLFDAVVRISVKDCYESSNINLEYTLDTALRSNVSVYILAVNNNESYTEFIEPFKGGMSAGAMSFAGTKESSEATFIYDLSNVVPNLNSDNFNDYDWYINFTDVKSYGSDCELKISNVKVVDNNNKKTYTSDNLKSAVTINNSELVTNIKNGYNENKSSDLQIMDFSFSNGNSVCMYDSVNIGAWAYGGSAPYEYKFTYFTGDGKEVVLSDYSQSNVISNVFKEAGTYKCKVYVKDASGDVKTAIKELTVKKAEITNIEFFKDVNGNNCEYFCIVPTIENKSSSIPDYYIDYEVNDGQKDYNVLNGYYNGAVCGSWTPEKYCDYDVTVTLNSEDGEVLCSKSVKFTVDESNYPLSIGECRLGSAGYYPELGDNEIYIGEKCSFTVFPYGGEPNSGEKEYTFSYGYEQDGKKYYLTSNENFIINSFSNVTPFVTVTDSKGRSITKTLDEYKVVGDFELKYNTYSDNIAYLNEIKGISFEAFCGAKDSNGNLKSTKVTVQKDGNTVASSDTLSVYWTPSEIGSYSVTAVAEDTLGRKATKTITCNVVNSNNIAKILYNGFDTPYIHYQVDNKSWTLAPGYKMIDIDSYAGYTHTFNIDLGNASGVTVCFNDGNGNWDNNGGKNYRLEAGTYFYSNGNLNKINTNSVHFTKFVVNNNKTEYEQPSTTRVLGLQFDFDVAGGTAPYTYEYGFYHGGEKICMVKDTVYEYYSFNMPISGIITPYVIVTDANGETFEQKAQDINIQSLKVELVLPEQETYKVNYPIYLDVNCTNLVKNAAYSSYYRYDIYKDGYLVASGESYGGGMNWVPTEPGTYEINAYVTDAIGQSDNDSKTIVVIDDKLSISSFNVTPESANVCDDISMNADASNGTAPYQYKFSFTKDGKETVVSDYSSNNTASFRPQESGDYTLKVTVKDADGNTVTKEKTVNVKQTSITKLNASKSSATVGETVKFSSVTANESENITAENYYYTVTKDGNVQELSTSSDKTSSWTPSSEGTYTITLTIKSDNGNVIATKSINYTVSEKSAGKSITIYYKGYSTPYIHYQTAGGTWTTAPGKAMEASSEVEGYTHKYIIELGDADYATVCFNDGNGNWDSNNGANYRFNAGTYTFSNGQIKEYVVDNSFKVSKISTGYTGSMPITYYYMGVSAEVVNGSGLYNFQFGIIKENGEEIVFKDYDNYAKSYTSEYAQLYLPSVIKGDETIRPFVRVKDSDGNVAYKAGEPIKIETVKITSFTVTPNGEQNVGQTVYIDYETENQALYHGMPHAVLKVYQDSELVDEVNFSGGEFCWTPKAAGVYTLKLVVNDLAGQHAEKSIQYVVKGEGCSDNTLTIYYKGYNTPYIHYQIGSGEWTTAPGKEMIATDEKVGYTHKYSIDLGSSDYANICFNDGNGNWDSCNGKNYRFEAGVYTYSNGQMQKIS